MLRKGFLCLVTVCGLKGSFKLEWIILEAKAKQEGRFQLKAAGYKLIIN